MTEYQRHDQGTARCTEAERRSAREGDVDASEEQTHHKCEGEGADTESVHLEELMYYGRFLVELSDLNELGSFLVHVDL